MSHVFSNLDKEAEERRNKSFKMCHGNSITTSEFEKIIIGEKTRNTAAVERETGVERIQKNALQSAKREGERKRGREREGESVQARENEIEG